MPWNDWQFWFVTAMALAAALWMGRGFLPFARWKKANSDSCGNCASGSASSRTKRRVALTIEKKRI